MAFADILLHLDQTKSCAVRLAVAMELAKRFGARLTGLYVMTHQYYQPRDERAEAAVEAVRHLFEEQTESAGVESQWQYIDWSVIGVGATEIINNRAHYTDLVIVGQAAPGEAASDLPERVVLGAGRPVLIVPWAGSFPTVGERVLVAWKAGREATRAVNDALPLLKQAKRVEVLAINSSETYGDDGESLCADICQHLRRHGVKAQADRMVVADTPVGDALLNRSCEEGYDLLVMGAYAHTPQGKMTLGAVAAQLLKQMTVPVLMSH